MFSSSHVFYTEGTLHQWYKQKASGSQISLSNLFSQMHCQSRFVDFHIVPLQPTRDHDSILINVLAVHCMHKKHLICFYKNLPLSGFHPIVHFHITECFTFFASVSYLVISRLILLYLFCFSQMTCRHLPLSWHVRNHLEHQQMQWRDRDRLAQRDSCRTMDWPNYFPTDFHMNNTGCLDLNHMPQIPEADLSVLKSHVISAHYTGLRLNPFCVSLFVISSLVWSTRILPNGFDYPICSENPLF